MKTETEVVSGWDDLIFENRNKEYGAYDIRKSYSGNTTTAMMICVVAAAGVLLLSGFTLLSKNDLGKTTDGPVIHVIPDPRIKVIKPPVKPEVLRKLTPPNRNFPPVLTPHDPVTEPPVLSQSNTVETGSETGDPNVEVSQGGELSLGTGETGPVVETNKVFDIAEVMPRYDGGLEAMGRFLRSKLRYPAKSKRMGIEGTVFVEFVVNYTGDITDVKIVKGISEDCDKEAVRVISMMPSWIAGSQQGFPVSVRMVLPVRFVLSK